MPGVASTSPTRCSMARRRVHMKKSVLSKSTRERLPASDFVFPRERRFPIHDEFHGRLALIYVMSPSHAESRAKVVKAVLSRYPELRSFWESREGAVERRRLRPAKRRPAARPAARRPAAVALRRPRAGARLNPASEESMPVYVLNPLLSEMRENPLAYDETPVIMVGKPQFRLVRGKAGHKQRSKQKYLPSSETHAMNPKTGGAFCGAGLNRSGTVKAGEVHRTDKSVVTCMRCIKIIKLNDVDRSVPGMTRRLAIIERDLKPGSAKKREKHQMIRGGDQGRFVSGSGAHIRSGKAFRVHKERTAATGGPMYRGSEGISDFQKYAGYRGRPTQTVGEKRSRMGAERVTAAERRRLELAAERRRESGLEERLALMEEFGPGLSVEEMEAAREVGSRRARMAAMGRKGATSRRAAAAEREAGRRAAAAGAAASRRGAGSAEEYMDNPRRRKKSRVAQKAGLKKGQGLMQKAAAAYRAGKYPTMQSALRGVARKSNPLSEDGMVVNPRRKGRKAAKRGGRTAAQSDAARAMSLFRSGKADTLAEAWSMVKRGR